MAIKTNPEAPDVYDQIRDHFDAHNKNYEKAQRKEKGLGKDAALPQYQHQAFPKMLYREITRPDMAGEAVAKTQEDLTSLLSNGWREQPFPPKVPVDKTTSLEQELKLLKDQVALLTANATAPNEQPPTNAKKAETEKK